MVALSCRQVDRVFAACASNSAGSTAVPTTRRASMICATPSSCAACCCWQAQGIDIDQAMLALSTYVGHAMVTNTYWYLTAVPELMAVAAERFEPLMQARRWP